MAKDNHHIVPQFYLRNFANGVARKARFTAFEKGTGRSFGAVVRDVAATRHFNRIKVDDGTDPDALENAIAQIEGEWAPLVAEVIAAGGFPSGLHREAVLTLTATLSLRSGRFRGAIHDLLVETATKMMDVNLSSKERWQAAHPEEYFPYEELKKFWDDKVFDLTFEQTYFIARELEAIGPVYEILDRRNWRFVRPGAEPIHHVRRSCRSSLDRGARSGILELTGSWGRRDIADVPAVPGALGLRNLRTATVRRCCQRFRGGAVQWTYCRSCPTALLRAGHALLDWYAGDRRCASDRDCPILEEQRV